MPQRLPLAAVLGLVLAVLLAAAAPATAPSRFEVLGPLAPSPSRPLDGVPPALGEADEESVAGAGFVPPEGFAWRSLAAEGEVLDLARILGDEAKGIVYARTFVNAKAARPALLVAGSDEGLIVWLNRARVHRTEFPRAFAPDLDRVEVDLAAGWNEILIKVQQVAGPFRFGASLTTRAGVPLELPERGSPPARPDEVLALDPYPGAEAARRMEALFPPALERLREWRQAAEKAAAAAGSSSTLPAVTEGLGFLRAIEAPVQALARARRRDQRDRAADELAAALSGARSLGLAGYGSAGDDIARAERALAGGSDFLERSASVPRERLWDALSAAGTVLDALERLAEAAAGEAAEALELERADAAIERHRTAPLRVAVTGAGGKPLAGVAVSIRQTASDFRFGANLYLFDRARSAAEEEAYRERFAALFNHATTDLYWRDYEPEPGAANHARTEAVARWCAERGMRLKGHPLLWSHPSAVPAWSAGPPGPELQRARVLDLVTRFRGLVHSYDVVNEPAHTRQPVDDPYRWAHAADPTAELVVNDFGVLADGYPPFLELLEGMKRRGVPFDAVGIQGHEPLHTRFPLEQVRRHLDRYAALGKPLHLTELTPCSGGQPILGSHRRGVWSEREQADYAGKLYRVAFAHPAVAAISWWDLSDQGAWQKGGGLLREDMSPKAAYEALSRLILERFRTRVEGRTDAAGVLAVRAFPGRHEVAAGGEKRVVQVRAGSGAEVVLDLP